MYYILKPFDNDMVINRIKTVGGKSTRRGEVRATFECSVQSQERNLELDVTNVIHEIGVPAHLKEMCIRDRVQTAASKRGVEAS